jgi:hypothetical protein
VVGRRARAPLAAAALAAAALGAAALAPAGARAQGAPALGAGRVGAQVALGVPAGAVGYVAGGLATRFVARRLGASDGRASQLADAGTYVGIAFFTAVPPALIGARGPGSGRYLAAVGGAGVGELASALVARVGRRAYGDRGDRGGRERACTLGCKALGALAFTLPSVGAAAGYNLSRRR